MSSIEDGYCWPLKPSEITDMKPPTDLPTLKANAEKAIDGLYHRDTHNHIRTYLDALERERDNAIAGERAITQQKADFYALIEEQRKRIAELEQDNENLLHSKLCAYITEKLETKGEHSVFETIDNVQARIAELERLKASGEWLGGIEGANKLAELERGCQEPKPCPACGGDGIETCDNPDHGFIDAVGGETGRLGCPGCGHDPNHKMKGPCPDCNGTGKAKPTLTFSDALRIARGCLDEHRDCDNNKEIRDGIQTVINALEAAEKGGKP